MQLMAKAHVYASMWIRKLFVYVRVCVCVCVCVTRTQMSTCMFGLLRACVYVTEFISTGLGFVCAVSGAI